MAVNWNAGNIRWQPHTDEKRQSFPLNHLHPFRFQYSLPAEKGHAARDLWILVGFGLHCFTRDSVEGDPASEFYTDDREKHRVMCYRRYQLSKRLKEIVQGLDKRPCQFARDDNYLTVDIFDEAGKQVNYAVFFNLKKTTKPDDILLVVQSAYELEDDKPLPKSSKISFKVLVGHTVRGTKPKR